MAITFDDGYVDVLAAALPVLERFDLPATVFLPTGWLGSSRRFWWDDLARVVLTTRSLPETLELDLGRSGRMFRWQSDPTSDPSHEIAGAAAWKAWEEPRCGRHRLYRRLWEELLPLDLEQQRRHLAALREWAGLPDAGADGDRCLTGEEVRRLQAGGRIDLGGHTVHHPQLSTLSPSDQRSEIEEGLAEVRRLASTPVRAFAFPYGKREHYTAETVELVRRAGFEWAMTNVEGRIDAASCGLELPRCFVEDGDGDSLARSLARWTGVATRGRSTVSIGDATKEGRSTGSRAQRPAPGRVKFGDLRRLQPVSRSFGFDRGSPVDRYYIERFLDRHRLAIQGRVLEIGDDRYTRQFGGDRVERSDVLHVESGHPGVNLVGDLASADHLPSDTWDAIVCTQTLHLVFDVGAALKTLERILKPGGTLLATVPRALSDQ